MIESSISSVLQDRAWGKGCQLGKAPKTEFHNYLATYGLALAPDHAARALGL